QRINALHLPSFKHLFKHNQENTDKEPEKIESAFWHRWAINVMKHPIIIILLVLTFLGALSWPIFSISLGSTSMTSVPKGVEARQGMDILNAQFPATGEHPILIVVQASDGSSMLSSSNLTKLDHLTQWIKSQSSITGVTSLTQIPSSPGTPGMSVQQLTVLYSTGTYQQYPALKQLVIATTNNNITLITATTNASVDSSAGKTLVNHLRAGDKTAAEGLTVLIGGEQAISIDFSNNLYSNFPWAIASILIATYILLLLMFRSVLLPLKAI